MSPIKPCPFCGSIRPQIEDIHDSLAMNGVLQIECEHCGVTMAQYYSDLPKRDRSEAHRELVKSWNRRNVP